MIYERYKINNNKQKYLNFRAPNTIIWMQINNKLFLWKNYKDTHTFKVKLSVTPYFHQRCYQNKPPSQIVTLFGQSIYKVKSNLLHYLGVKIGG